MAHESPHLEARLWNAHLSAHIRATGKPWKLKLTRRDRRSYTMRLITMQMQRWRERHSMNRAQMAALVGVSRATITKWESGLTFPSPENIRKVRRITNGEVTETDWHRLHDRTRKPLAADDNGK
jgi:DNA-binding XRE family transcriptional regulator